MRSLFFCCFILFTSVFGDSLRAQQLSLRGEVFVHNSLYRTGQLKSVAGASVEAAFAGSTVSDARGKFQLIFAGLEDGESTNLSVEKAGLEVVNERDMLQVVLGRKSPLRVYLAPKGELAQRQTEYYEVSLAALTNRYDALISSLRADTATSRQTISELKQRLNREIANRYEAEDILTEQLAIAKERLPEKIGRAHV